MRQFHATTVEAHTGDGVLVVHFDDQADHYLQLQAPEECEPDETEDGFGSVFVEVDDQLYSGLNCFSAAELSRDRFRIVPARDEPLVRQVGEVVVTFELDDDAFGELRRGLEWAFRAFPGFRVTADP